MDYFYPAWEYPIWESTNNPIADIQTDPDLLEATGTLMTKMVPDNTGPLRIYYICARDRMVNFPSIKKYFTKINKLSLYTILESYTKQTGFANFLAIHKKDDGTHWVYIMYQD